jgi:hypothetical protein
MKLYEGHTQGHYVRWDVYPSTGRVNLRTAPPECHARAAAIAASVAQEFALTARKDRLALQRTDEEQYVQLKTYYDHASLSGDLPLSEKIKHTKETIRKSASDCAAAAALADAQRQAAYRLLARSRGQ